MSQEFEEGKRKYTMFHVRPYKVCEMAAMYQVSAKTFRKWLTRIRNKIGKTNGHYLLVEQVEIIIQHFKLIYR